MSVERPGRVGLRRQGLVSAAWNGLAHPQRFFIHASDRELHLCSLLGLASGLTAVALLVIVAWVLLSPERVASGYFHSNARGVWLPILTASAVAGYFFGFVVCVAAAGRSARLRNGLIAWCWSLLPAPLSMAPPYLGIPMAFVLQARMLKWALVRTSGMPKEAAVVPASVAVANLWGFCVVPFVAMIFWLGG